MNTRKLGWLCLSLGLLACPNPPPAGDCGGESCTAEQRCDAATLHCVSDAAPVVTLVAPTVTVTLDSFVVSGTVTDDGEFTAEMKIGSGSATPLTLGMNGDFRLTVPAPADFDSVPLTISVTARDAHHEITVSKDVLIDRLGPSLLVTRPVNGSVQTGVIDLGAVTQGAATEVSVLMDGVRTQLTGGPTVWSAPPLTPPTLDSELLRLEVTAVDAAGNATTAYLSVMVDNVAPQVTINSPAANSIHGSAITVSASTVGAADGVTLMFEGGSAPLTGGPTAWTLTFLPPQHDYASNVLRVTAQDANGNSSFAELAIVTDTVAPVINFTAPMAAQKFKASDFASGPNVTSTWTVTDGDPQAATTTVNGAASTALTTAVPTNATDNPASYMTTVVAADRAGNTSTNSISYSVDRVVPTVVSWTPAANSRMVEPPETLITFSEPVFALSSTTSGLLVLANPQPPGDAWELNHSRSRLPLALYRGRAVRVGVNALADDYGNPLGAVGERRFHLPTTFASGTLLASNVGSFSATADPDGVLTVSYVTTSGGLRVVSDSGGNLVDRGLVLGISSASKVVVNSWSTPDPFTLDAVLHWGTSIYNPAASAASRYIHLTGHGLLSPDTSSTTTVGAVVSAPPLNREGATEPTGIVLGSTYTRGTFTRTFTTIADMMTAQSADSWAAASYTGTQVRWSRYRCNRDTQVFPGPATYTCGGTEYGATTALPADFGETVMTRSGSCMIFNLRYPQGGSNFAYGGFAQRLENCDGALGVSPPASCNPNTTFPSSPGNIGQKLAPYSYNGEDTILFAFPAGTGNPSEFRLEKMTSGTCGFSTTFTPVITVPNVRDYQPVQIGTKPAFIYVNTSNELRVFIP